MSSLLFAHRCHVLNAIFLWCVSASPVGSRVDVSNESDVKIDNTEDQYLSINEKVKKENPGYLFYFGYQQTRQADPPLNL
jgi:hypothetical protein